MTRKMGKKLFRGFTLSELLIALAILGVIATFTIPKVLQAQQDGKYKAMTKEAVAAVSQAYETYKIRNQMSGALSLDDLKPYLNYIKRDTVSVIDFDNTASSSNCSTANSVCLLLANGGILRYWNSDTFGGTTTSHAIPFHFDPDAKTTAVDAPGRAVRFWLYANGKVRTSGTIEPNTQCGCSDNGKNPTPAEDPAWFNWN